MSTLASQTPGRADADFEEQTCAELTSRLIPFVCLCFVITFLDRVNAAAAGIALIISLGNLAGFVSPYMLGRIKDSTGSTNIAPCVLAGLPVMAGAIVLALPRDVTRR